MDVKMDVDAFLDKNLDARGVAVIIGNEEYDDPRYNNLPGAMKDANAMESTFKYLQFATVFLRNAKLDVICGTIRDLAFYRRYPTRYDCFAVVFAGHGGSNNTIVSSDGHDVSIEEAIIKQLDDSRHIANIKKIVFIDACRGEKDNRRPRNENDFAIPTNMFVAYSTKDGYTSHEIVSEGGMWMQILAKELRWSKKSVGDTVADVNTKVKAMYSDWIQPQIYNTTVNIVLSAGLNGASFSPPSPSQVPATAPSTLPTTPSTFSDGDDTDKTVADGDDTDEARSSQQTGYVSTLPESVRRHLKQPLDWDHNGLDTDLDYIAHVMGDWEVHSSHLGLTHEDVGDIKRVNRDNPGLQRREALRIWKNNQMGEATYGKLLQLFVDIKQSRWAEAVCDVLKKRN